MRLRAIPAKDRAHRAPGRLEALRSFLNTIDFEAQARGEEADRLSSWVTARQPGAPALSEPDLERLRAFREALRAVTGPGDSSEPPWAGLEPYASAAGYRLRADSGRLRLAAMGFGADRIVAGLLAILYDALLTAAWPRLRTCRKESCRWAFFDRSKNASGTWCNMAICGNRVKAQKRRARQKTGASIA